MSYTDTIEALRERAQRHRERGNVRLAKLYEKEVESKQRIAEIDARAVLKSIQVRGIRYSVRLNYNAEGKWYANAHSPSGGLPAAYVSGHASCEDALAAIRADLRENR